MQRAGAEAREGQSAERGRVSEPDGKDHREPGVSQRADLVDQPELDRPDAADTDRRAIFLIPGPLPPHALTNESKAVEAPRHRRQWYVKPSCSSGFRSLVARTAACGQPRRQ